MLLFNRLLFNTILIICLGLIGSTNSYTQSIKFNHLTVEDGLSNNKVNTITQDKTGFIWFGTEDGLSRFDGYNFKVYRHDPSDSNTLSNNSIWALLEDRQGNIWIGTKDGKVNIFNPISEKINQITPQPKLKDWNSITALFEDNNGNIWIGTRSTGVYEYNPESKEFTHWPFDSLNVNSLSHFSVRSIIQDQQDNIIAGTYRGLNKLYPNSAGKEIKKYYHETNNSNSLSSSQIYNLTGSSLNPEIVWIGTPTGLHKFNSNKDSITRIKIPNKEKLQFGEGASTVIEEIIDGHEIIWTDTYSGLLRINLTTGSSHRFTENQNEPGSLINNQINKIFKDRSGVIWIATENGVSFYSPKSTRFNSPFNDKTQIFLKASKLKNNLRAVVQDKNKNVWLGFSDGLISMLNSAGGNLSKSNPQLDKFNVWSLSADSENSLWIGTYGQGLKKYNLNTGTQKDLQLIYKKTNEKTVPFIKSLFTDSKNNLWIGYWGSGLGLYNPLNGTSKVWRPELDNPSSLNFQDVWSITEDRFGRIWLGTPGGGLNLVKDFVNDLFEYWVHSERDSNSLSSNSIFTVYVAKYNHALTDSNLTILWVGSNNGLNRFLINNRSMDLYDFSVDIKHFTKNNGLSDNNVNSILEDDNGNLWIGTSSGISFFDIDKESFINFSRKDGINGITMNPNAALKLDDGLMIFGSTDGLNIVNPAEVNFSRYKPNIVITDFQIFNKSIEPGNNSPLKKSISYTEEIELSHNQDVFSFEFAALDYNSPQSIQYAYMMEGFDKEWIYSGNRRLATYTNLNPDEYTFKVKSTNADGVWNENVKSILIVITPPFWMTWWFRGLLIIIFLSVGPIIYYRRVKQLKTERQKREEFSKRLIQSQEEERKRIASELHDSIGQNLLIIKNYASIGKKSEDYEAGKKQFDEISNNAASAIDEVRRIAYNLHPYHLERLGLTNAILSIIDNAELSSQINFDIKSDNVDNILIKETEINLFRIIQECINNIIKHSRAEKAEITIAKKEFEIVIDIRDNGIGFSQSGEVSAADYAKGFGLENLKKRINLIKGDFKINSEPGKGTRIFIKVPI